MAKVSEKTKKAQEEILEESAKTKVVKKKVVKKKVVKKKRKVNYLNNKDLLKQVILSKEQEKMTERLAHMLQTLCMRYAKRGQFAGYTFNEDMQAFAMMMIVRTWNAFNPEKSQNPFAFYTQCIKNSFRQFLNQEKRQRDIRDELLVSSGLSPSHTYMTEYETQQNADKHHTDDEEDFGANVLEVVSEEDCVSP